MKNKFEQVPKPKTKQEVYNEKMGELQRKERQLQEELVKVRGEMNRMIEQAQEEEETEIMS